MKSTLLAAFPLKIQHKNNDDLPSQNQDFRETGQSRYVRHDVNSAQTKRLVYPKCLSDLTNFAAEK